MRTLLVLFKLLLFLIVSVGTFSLFIAIEVYIVYAADIHLINRGINISWILWSTCVIVILFEIISFSIKVLWRLIFVKIRELFMF